jgi:hypothetical protein
MYAWIKKCCKGLGFAISPLPSLTCLKGSLFYFINLPKPKVVSILTCHRNQKWLILWTCGGSLVVVLFLERGSLYVVQDGLELIVFHPPRLLTGVYHHAHVGVLVRRGTATGLSQRWSQQSSMQLVHLLASVAPLSRAWSEDKTAAQKRVAMVWTFVSS